MKKSIRTAPFRFLLLSPICLAIFLSMAARPAGAQPVLLASGLSGPSGLTSDGNAIDPATTLYFAETIGTKTFLRSVSANGSSVGTVVTGDAVLDSGAYRGIHMIVLSSLANYFWGGIGGYETSYLFSSTPSGANKLTTFSGGALIGNASVNLIYFDQFNRLRGHTMFTDRETVIGTGYWPGASASSFIEMYFQDRNDRRIYRVDYNSTTSTSSVQPFAPAMSSEGNLFIGGGYVFFATATRILRLPTAGGPVTEVVSGFSGAGFAADGRYVYYVDGSSLKYVANGGGPSAVLATVPVGGVTGMIVTDIYVNPVIYWSQSDGKIFKLTAPKTAPVAPVVSGGRLINLSILGPLAAGETMTMGTVLGGAGTSGAKALLARAAGPSLAQLGVESVLPRPTMTLNNTAVTPAAIVATNTGWGGATTLTTAFTAVGAFPYTSTASLDSAIFQQNLPAGSYTVQVRDVGGSAGNVITELYDSTPSAAFTSATPRLINVSVLKQIAAGSSVAAGFVVGGSGGMKVLLRAVGPTLEAAPFNVQNVLANPKLELINNANQQALSVNTGWGGSTTLSTVFTSVGAFKLANTETKDSVLLVTLTPGQYTARVSGADGGGGTVIVEVYEVP